VAADAQGPGPEDDLEEALAHLAAAVETPGLRHVPQQYASALGQLGNAYDLRRRGDRTSTVEHALGYLTRWREAGGSGDPAHRISVLALTAKMHMSRAGGTRSDNIEAAIEALDTAEGLVGDVVHRAAQPGISTL